MSRVTALRQRDWTDPARHPGFAPNVPFDRAPVPSGLWTPDEGWVLSTALALLCTGISYTVRMTGPDDLCPVDRHRVVYELDDAVELCGDWRRLTLVNDQRIADWCGGYVPAPYQVAVPTRGGWDVAEVGDVVARNGAWFRVSGNRNRVIQHQGEQPR